MAVKILGVRVISRKGSGRKIGESSETIRQTLAREMIWSDLQSDLKSQAEMPWPLADLKASYSVQTELKRPRQRVVTTMNGPKVEKFLVG
jgi:hypothetical protein